jgi:hypothetical protein
MKHILIATAVAALCLTALPSCGTPTTPEGIALKAKAGAVTDFALRYAVRTGKVSPQDYADIKELKEIILPSAPAAVPSTPAPADPVYAPSGKEAVPVLGLLDIHPPSGPEPEQALVASAFQSSLPDATSGLRLIGWGGSP